MSMGSGSSTVTSDPTNVTYFSDRRLGHHHHSKFVLSHLRRHDINAEDLVNQQAGIAEVTPKILIDHGGNFNWNRIDSADGRDSRFTTTFESKFDGLSFVDECLTNHDYGAPTISATVTIFSQVLVHG